MAVQPRAFVHPPDPDEVWRRAVRRLWACGCSMGARRQPGACWSCWSCRSAAAGRRGRHPGAHSLPLISNSQQQEYNPLLGLLRVRVSLADLDVSRRWQCWGCICTHHDRTAAAIQPRLAARAVAACRHPTPATPQDNNWQMNLDEVKWRLTVAIFRRDQGVPLYADRTPGPVEGLDRPLTTPLQQGLFIGGGCSGRVYLGAPPGWWPARAEAACRPHTCVTPLALGPTLAALPRLHLAPPRAGEHDGRPCAVKVYARGAPGLREALHEVSAHAAIRSSCCDPGLPRLFGACLPAGQDFSAVVVMEHLAGITLDRAMRWVLGLMPALVRGAVCHGRFGAGVCSGAGRSGSGALASARCGRPARAWRGWLAGERGRAGMGGPHGSSSCSQPHVLSLPAATAASAPLHPLPPQHERGGGR